MKPLLRSSVCIGALIRDTCLVLVIIKISQFEQLRSAPTTELDSLPLETHQLQNEFASNLPPSSYHQMNSFMQVHKLSPTSNNITCNDGSPVGYYMRLNNHSKSWIIYLQGGGFCWSEESCQQRWQRNPNLMSSHSWPKTKTVDGILSSELKENPYLWNANHIYVPYCSSDSWTGLAPFNKRQSNEENDRGSFSFMGSKIVETVLESLYEDLPRDSSLYAAKFILLAGDSAGATGVIMNLDKVNGIVERKANSYRTNCTAEGQSECQQRQAPVLRGLADSGWFLDNEPYDFGKNEGAAESGEQESADSNRNCDHSRCSPVQSIRQAMRLWNGQLPTACESRHPTEPWLCYFGYRAYQTLKTPLFVVQWLYDEAQLMVDYIARPDTTGQWNYVNKVVNEMRASLENVTALFAPSCFSHSLVIRKTWNQININGFKLPHVLNSWEEQSLLDTTSAIASPSLSTLDPTNRFTINSADNSPQLNVSVPSIVNQPTFEALFVEQESNHSPIFVKDADKPKPILETRPHKQVSSSSNNSNRSRSRKRRRNNQQHKPKQTRPKMSHQPESYSNNAETVTTGHSPSKESNELVSSANPLQDLLPLIDRSLASADLLFSRINRDSTNTNNGRLGRSTLVDDTTLMLSNNVPDESSDSATNLSTLDLQHRQESKFTLSSTTNLEKGSITSHAKNLNSDRFRLVDSCGWPQCNRDCPNLEPEFSFGGSVVF